MVKRDMMIRDVVKRDVVKRDMKGHDMLAGTLVTPHPNPLPRGEGAC